MGQYQVPMLLLCNLFVLMHNNQKERNNLSNKDIIDGKIGFN